MPFLQGYNWVCTSIIIADHTKCRISFSKVIKHNKLHTIMNEYRNYCNCRRHLISVRYTGIVRTDFFSFIFLIP